MTNGDTGRGGKGGEREKSKNAIFEVMSFAHQF